MQAAGKSGDHLLHTLHPNQYSKLIEAFLKGQWPVLPVPTVFEYRAYLANTISEQSQLIADILHMAINPALIEAFYDATDWDKVLKAQMKNQKSVIAKNTAQKPTRFQFIVEKMGEIIRAIATPIASAKKYGGADQKVMERITYLRFHLASKPHLIQAALQSEFIRSSWKDHMYGMSLHDISMIFYPEFNSPSRYLQHITQDCRSVVLADTSDQTLPLRLNEALASGFTVDAHGNCSGFCGVTVHCEPDDTHATRDIRQTLHGAAKQALRLIATLPSSLKSLENRDELQEMMRCIASETLHEMNSKTDEKHVGISLLVYRAIKIGDHLHIIGFNIGNSVLLLHDPNGNKLYTLANARKFKTKPESILLGKKYSQQFDTILIDEPSASLDSSLVALSPGAQETFTHGNITEQQKSQRKYISYTLSTDVIDIIEKNLASSPSQKNTASAITQAFQDRHLKASPKNAANKLPSSKWGSSLSISVIKMPASTHMGIMKNHAQKSPCDSILLHQHKQRIKLYLADQFRKSGILSSEAYHVNRILSADFDNLYDFAAYLEAERNALTFRLIASTPFQIILKNALAIFAKELNQTSGETTNEFNQYLLTDSERGDQGIFYNPIYNREFASRLLACAYKTKVNANKAANFHEKNNPQVTWSIATIAIAGTLAKQLIRCHNIDDYQQWMVLANQKHTSLPEDSELAKAIKQIIVMDLPKVIALPSTAIPSADSDQTTPNSPRKIGAK